nr:metal-dependent transcriptional regulator [Brevibacterium otitidis]
MEPAASVSALTASAQNYLKIIWSIQEWDPEREPVQPSLIAERAGLRMSTVSDAIKRLSRQGLVAHTRYGAVSLTDEGQAHALQMVRRHRLIETFLVQVLGYGWDEVHDEAEVLEHAVSDELVDRIAAHLGNPDRDPHGDPIPAADGRVVTPRARQLSDCEPGASYRLERISDADSELLQFLAGKGIEVGTDFTLSAGAPYSGTLVLEREGEAELTLGAEAAAAMWVSSR